MKSGRSSGAVLAAIALASFLSPSAARADNPFAGLGGTWSGAGQVKFAGGKSEQLKCKAYYTPKDASMGLAIRCASSSTTINLRAALSYSSGRVSGTWEERTFNASGAVSGQASAGRISVSITGGGFTGSMSVGTTGGSQSVVIQTEGIGMRSVNINLSKG